MHPGGKEMTMTAFVVPRVGIPFREVVRTH
jgi:hypothetical protein